MGFLSVFGLFPTEKEEQDVEKSVEFNFDGGNIESVLQRMIFGVVNQYRESIGLNAVLPDLDLFGIALAHNNYMRNTGDRKHTGWERRSELTTDLGFAPASYAENLAFCECYLLEAVLEQERVVESIVNGWLDSKGHKENIEIETHSRSGLACSIAPCGADNRVLIYVTQIFADR